MVTHQSMSTKHLSVTVDDRNLRICCPVFQLHTLLISWFPLALSFSVPPMGRPEVLRVAERGVVGVRCPNSGIRSGKN